MHHVVLYSRPGCCLCDEARELLDRVLADNPSAFRLDELDIETDQALHRAYLERIPVITIDGVERFELFVDETGLRERLGIVRTG